MPDKPPHIVIIRLSALGDIAISAPLVREYAIHNPEIKFTVVSQSFTEPLFLGIKNLSFFPINLKTEGNVKGLYQASKQIAHLKPTHIADFHAVIRSRILKVFLLLRGIPFSTIHKNRKARKELIKHLPNRELKPLTPIQRLYEDVLLRSGLKDLHFAEQVSTENLNNKTYREEIKKERKDYLTKLCSDNEELENETLVEYLKMEGFRIGIAPFAKHQGKKWNETKVEELIQNLGLDTNNKIFLFGGGIEEERVLMGWEQKYPNTFSVAGKFRFAEELLLMSSLDVMVSMDSANMHLASYTGTPVISVWGATDPAAGFYGWRQDKNNALRADMPCRPCSIYGNKPCKYGDFRCLAAITPQMVENKILEIKK